MQQKKMASVMLFVLFFCGLSSVFAVDPNNPPASMRVTVDKSGETRTFNLDKYSIRGPNFELVLLGTDGITQTTIDPGPVRNYRGWCEEEPDSYVEATLLPNGDLRYHVFKGPVSGWSYDPALVYDENASPDNNFTEIGGTPVQPSGTEWVGASWTDPAVALAALWETYGAGMGDLWRTTYQADVGFDLLVEYVDAFNYSDWETYGRKAENAISHYNAIYIRDGLLENQLGKVVIRQSQTGLDYTNGQWGVQWPNINYYWNALFPDVDHHFVGMVGSVGGGVAFGCEYAGEDWAARSFNGWSSGGNFWHVARHEMGHNNGAGDNMGPEWGTVMSGNSIPMSRFSTYEIDSWMNCRAGRSFVLRELGNYSYPVPPYAKYDDAGTICVDGGVFIDVLGNDYDANVDQIAISSFDTVTTLGGTVDFSPGSGPDGRDELVYLPSATAGDDAFTYRITDATGRIAQGNIVVTVTNELIVSPEDDITFAGLVEGPSFNVTSDTDTLTLSNVSTTSLDWTASKTQSWLTLSSSGGTISSSGSADVIITINAAADSLAAGEYTDTVTITDTTNSTVIEHTVVLTVTRDVIEGFDYDGSYVDISVTPYVSRTTGYTWSGYHTAWGLGLIDMLDFSGVNIGYDNWNAWADFNGSHVKNLGRISFKWHVSSTSDNLNARAVIKDANGNWFVSDDAVPDTADQTFSINAITATWKILNSDPVIGIPLDIGSAAIPDLSKIYGGGIQTVGLAAGAQTRLDTLSFISDGEPISFSEGFTPTDSGWELFNVTPEVSADTGYSWSGYSGGTWGSALYNWTGVGTYFATNGEGLSYEGVNAWTTFDGDYIPNVTDIKIEMAAAGLTNSGTVVIEAVIQDANGDWFVSDANCPDTAGTTGVIDVTTTTWRKLNNAPIINTPLDIAAAGTPDLSKVYGGGVNYRDLGTYYPSVRIDSLAFVYYETDPPTPDPAGFASPPVALSDTEITMTAFTGIDGNGPVEYYFDEISGNPGGTDSGWVTDPVYNDTGLERGVQYTYTVQMRDAVTPTPNVGIVSSPASAITFDTIITEDFTPVEGAPEWVIWHTPEVSADTGYSWSGYNTVHGLGMFDLYSDGDSELALSSHGMHVVGMNAWTVFDDGISGADSVANLAAISATGMASMAGSLSCQAIIQDANGEWFVSDDTALLTASTTSSISAVTTTWQAINQPVIGTAIIVTGAGTPDLSNVLGGGLNFTGGNVGWLGVEKLTFVGALPGDFEPDGDVDIADLSYLAQRWLWTGCASPDWCEGADLDHLGGVVNLLDFALFAENWLK